MQPRDLTKDFVANYAARELPDSDPILEVEKISMLHRSTLGLLRLFARVAAGQVLELGPYVGGSTIAAALGLRDAGAGRIRAVELGGHYKSQPSLPSLDILADLDRNLRQFGVRDLVQITQGRPDDRRVIREVKTLLEPKSIRLLIVDLDGCVGRDFWVYEPYMADDCLIVFDDYTSPGSDKGVPTKRFVDRAIVRGLVDDLGVYEWGTWFGRLRRRATRWERARWMPFDMMGRSGALRLALVRLDMWRRTGAYYPPYDI